MTHCIVKATLAGECRRFALASIDRNNILGEADKLTFENLHSQLCSVFNQKRLSITYQQPGWPSVHIRTDSDVLDAVKAVSASTPKGVPTILLKVKTEISEVDPIQNVTESLSSASISAENDPASTDTGAGKYILFLALHPNVYCDICVNNIRGIRWKCQDCSNFDLCQSCIGLAQRRHSPNHTFKPLGGVKKQYNPTKQPASSASSSSSSSSTSSTINPARNNGSTRSSESNGNNRPAKHMAICDICQYTIYGVRHKCLQCYDYDVCQSCLPMTNVQHFEDHDFHAIEYPGQMKTLVDPTPHDGIVCDGCNKDIYGIRYKCGNCADFDLCGNCETVSPRIHNPEHVFIKIRKPTRARLTPQYPLLPNMYQRGWGKMVCFHPYATGQQCPEGVTLCLHVQCSRGSQSCARATGESSKATGEPPKPTNEQTEEPPKPTDEQTEEPSKPVEKKEELIKTKVETPKETPSIAMEELPGTTREPLNSVVQPPKTTKESPVMVEKTIPIADVHINATPTEQESAVPSTMNSTFLSEAPSGALSAILSQAIPSGLSSVAHSTIHLAHECAESQGRYGSHFVKDINLHDGTVIQAGSQFLKIWETLNCGKEQWPEGTTLRFISGDKMFTDTDIHLEEPSFKIPIAAVQESVCITADLKAPAQPGRYVSFWRLVTPEGVEFGHRYWCDITVEELSDSSSDSIGSSTMVFPTMDANRAWSVAPSELTTDRQAGDRYRAVTATVADSTTSGAYTTDHHAAATEDLMSTTSGRYTAYSDEEEESDGQDDDDDDASRDIGTDRFFSDDEFVVVDSEGED
ncbi:hypothetical protein BGW38_003533 [Lunasporangiospora selenospora]|uniref:ZZ-type domain-containing protein n=1 Tax=Lunasporangiospora selenospora TaxID=979761 RepID=A0A9P6FQJ1_9FUNG|nr:hypothetical protein BGW38_003533 [Lunasporangiospora selenospora]